MEVGSTDLADVLAPVAASLQSASLPPATPDASDTLNKSAQTVQNFSDKLSSMLGPMHDQNEQYVQRAISALGGGLGGAGGVAAGAQQAAQGQIQVNNANAAAAIQKKADDMSAAELSGMVPGKPAQDVVDLIGTIRDSAKRYNAQSQVVQGLDNTSFWDDPIGFVQAQIALPFEQETLADIGKQRDGAYTALSQLSKTFDDQAKTNATIDVADANTVAGGLNKEALGKAQIAAGESAMRAAALNLEGVKFSAQMTQQDYANTVQAYSAAHSTFGVIDAMTKLPYYEAAKQQMIDSHQERLSQMLATDAGKQAVVARANDYIAKTGGNPISSIQEFNKLPKAYQDKVMVGADSLDFAMGKFGPDINSSVNTVKLLQPNSPNMSPGLLQTVQDFDKQISASLHAMAAADPTGLAAMRKDPASFSDYKSSVYQSYIDKLSTNIPPTGSILSPPSLAQGLRQSNTQIGNLLTPVASAPGINMAMQPDLIVAAGMKLVDGGQMTMQQLGEEVSRIYTSAMVNNNNSKQFTRLGVNIPDATSNISMQLPGPNGVPVQVNLASPAAVTNYATRIKNMKPFSAGIFPGSVNANTNPLAVYNKFLNGGTP